MINKTLCSNNMFTSDKCDSFSMFQSYYPLLGQSHISQRIRQKIQFAAGVNFPVFISGEPGCEKKDVAYFIHKQSSRHLQPFVCIPANIHNPGSYRENIVRCIQQADGGTIYFEEIDTLKPVFKDELIFLFSMDLIQQKLRHNQVRLIVSCNQSLASSLRSQFLSKILGSSLLQIDLYLPPLKERLQDIEEHIRFITSALNKDIRFTHDALYLMKNYDWPGNIEQLQHILLSLASLPGTDITASDVINCGINTRNSGMNDVIDCLLTQQLDSFQCYHPALFKALEYLGKNYREDITLPRMSDASYTSASHLSYLFRKYLGRSFKTILCQLRVRCAQKLLSDNPHFKITDVCMNSGFGDLSHFEKMFKRYIGCTPRQYRNQKREALPHYCRETGNHLSMEMAAFDTEKV